MADFARRLERERDEARETLILTLKQLVQTKTENQNLKDAIRQTIEWHESTGSNADDIRQLIEYNNANG